MSFITTVSPNSVERFQRSCAWQTVSVVYFIFAKFLSSKGALLPAKKKKNFRISCKFAHLHIMSFITTTFHEILSGSFRGVALTYINRTEGRIDWLAVADGRFKNIIPSATCCVGHNNIETQHEHMYSLYIGSLPYGTIYLLPDFSSFCTFLDIPMSIVSKCNEFALRDWCLKSE